MFKVLVSDPISEIGLGKLLESPSIQVDIRPNLPKADLVQIIGEYDALLVRSQTKVDREVLTAGRKLKAVGRAGVGVDNIDVQAATDLGVIVINAPDGNTISTCEHTFAMLMALSRKIPQAHASTKAGKWDRKTYVGVELKNKVLGILGFGRIGTEVALRAKAFGMSVLAYDPFLTAERATQLGVELASIDQIVANADYITVHTPLTKETRHLISYDAFKRMKKGVRILNCARGGIIDEAALADAIRQGIVAGAALDVFETEPPENNPLLDMEQVVVTPHLGASTEEAQINVAIDVAEEIVNILFDQPFKNAVNLPSVPPDLAKKLRPYISLGEQLGKLAAQLMEGRPERIEVTYSGELASVDVAILTRSVLKGALSSSYGEEVNFINAPAWANEQGVAVEEIKSNRKVAFTSLIGVKIYSDERIQSVSGTSYQGVGPRIIDINGYTVDAAPQGSMLIFSHQDQPGMIGKVGMELGDADVNIASMQVGRKTAGGEAIMVLGVDKTITPDGIKRLASIPGVRSVRYVEFN